MRASPHRLSLEPPKRVRIHDVLGFSLCELDKMVLRCSLFDTFLEFGAIYDEVLDRMPSVTKQQVKSSMDKLVKYFLMTRQKTYAGKVSYRKVKRRVTLDET